VGAHHQSHRLGPEGDSVPLDHGTCARVSLHLFDELARPADCLPDAAVGNSAVNLMQVHGGLLTDPRVRRFFEKCGVL